MFNKNYNYGGKMMRFNEGGGMEAMMRGMQPPANAAGDPKKPEFMMTGQYASPVMVEGDREYVMYDTGVPGQPPVKVYGVWNEYAVARDEEGNDLIADEDFPIRKNEKGEYELDTEYYEATGPDVDSDEEAVGDQAEEEAWKAGKPNTQMLLEMLSKRRGPGM